MDKQEIRDLVLEEENTAQSVFETKLLTENKKINELSFLEPLHGNLNLGVLNKHGYTHIKSLYFSKGEITGITNLPEGLQKIVISNNLIKTIDLPDSIIYADLKHNSLDKLEVSHLVNLEILHVSFNNIRELNLRSDKLKELYCDHNKLVELNLLATTDLNVLMARYNPIMKVYNAPESLLIVQLPPESSFYNNHGNSHKKDVEMRTYKQAVNEYFQIKNDYELKLRRNMQVYKLTKGKKKTLILPGCFGCGGKRGMIFSSADYKYQAHCANTPACKWKIVIHRAQFEFQETLMEKYQTYMENIKEKIICQKMDTLFQHITEEKSAQLFEKHLEAYQKVSKRYGEMLDNYNENYYSESKKEIIQKKKLEIQNHLQRVAEALEEHNDFALAADIQINQISPIGKEIQRLSYEKTYMLNEDNNIIDMPAMRLMQEEVSLNNLETFSTMTVLKKGEEIVEASSGYSGWVEQFGNK